MTRPCITGLWRSLAQMQASSQLARAMQLPAQPLLELRLDGLEDASPAALARAVQHFGPQRLVVTCRGRAERGVSAQTTSQTELDATQRRALWLEAHRSGAAFIDVDQIDWLADTPLRRQLMAAGPTHLRSQIIVSQHCFAGVPTGAELWASFKGAAESGAHVFKLAYAVTTPNDALPVVMWAEEVAAIQASSARPGPALLPLAMGPAGSWSRLLVARQRVPAPLTYVCLEARAGTEPSQPILADVLDSANLAAIDADTPLYGILGNPLGHTRSPRLHNRILRRYGRAGLYVSFAVPGDPRPFLRALAPVLDVRGLSVTLPHKARVAEACVRRSQLARVSHAINTLVRAPMPVPVQVVAPVCAPVASSSLVPAAGPGLRPWRGSNTDGPALVASVARLLPSGLAGRRCLVLGTGGTAAVAAAAMRAAGARVAIWGRRSDAAAALAASLQAGTGQPCEAVGEHGLHTALGRCDVLVHATSVGMAPDVDACLLSAQALRQLAAGCLVVDCIYTPAPTLLLQRATARGLATLDGLDMFLRQAQGQARAFYGLRPSRTLLQQWMADGDP